MLILTLILAGILLISAELLVPGGILGAMGGISLLAACYFTYADYGLVATIILFIASLLLLISIIFLQFKLLRKSPLAKSVFLDASSGGKSLAERSSKSIPEDIIGKRGETLTSLSPAGTVIVDGITYEARLQNGLLRRGHTIEVIGVSGLSLIVKSV